METQQETWQNMNGKIFRNPITQLVEEAIIREQANGHRLKVCVGSDSHVYGEVISYATAVVLVREGKGAFTFIRKEKEFQRISIKERMLNEVNKSVEIAYTICALLDAYGVEMEVHADINTDPDFKSNAALRDAMGYILGMGYVFKAKPFAFASSNCADMMV
ncbi:ribonuclease H-like YkuK family protein [uncultured Chryseobacterium sp.]|uniref:ribonuclease H-like YkuK family protein n=1 Tax=uncultured Chryseobacterium sp. TaxID=259322 RepID=UPI0025D34231|nr:ribonuclease H-like YkuK family protein [uncultured Chryseobacterium sp.]